MKQLEAVASVRNEYISYFNAVEIMRAVGVYLNPALEWKG